MRFLTCDCHILCLFPSGLPAQAIFASSLAVRNNSRTNISWVLSSTATGNDPERIIVMVKSNFSVSNVTLGPRVRSYEAVTEPGESYNITIITVNGAGQVPSETHFLKVPAGGEYKTSSGS